MAGEELMGEGCRAHRLQGSGCLRDQHQILLAMWAHQERQHLPFILDRRGADF